MALIARSRLSSPAMLRGLQVLSGRGLHTSGSPLLSESDKSFDFVVCGGGAGGLAVASSLSKRFGEGKVAVIEPSENHYYQPMWTLVGGGIKTLEQSRRSMASVMPPKAVWLKTAVEGFEPENSAVVTADGAKIAYKYLIVAMGLRVNFDKIPGLTEALANPSSGVCSNFSAATVTKTFDYLQNFQGGTAIFTFPTMPIKCPGAPQKIMYLADDYFRKAGVRDKTKIMYNTALPVIFGVKKYAERLRKVVERKGIDVNYQHKLVEVFPDQKKAMFDLLAEGREGETVTFEYDLMHATPPMGPLPVMKGSPVSDELGWVDVDKKTLQHKKYPNIFGIGDCTNLPTSKTAAACAAESAVLMKNLTAVMKGTDPRAQYDGYTSCPLITGYNKCILAEFDFDGMPLETFPVDQGKERWSMYVLKADVMPELYWNGLLKGIWGGPGPYRKAMRFGLSK